MKLVKEAVISVFTIILIAGILFAIAKVNNINDLNDLYKYFKRWSDTAAQCNPLEESCAGVKIPLPNNTPATPNPGASNGTGTTPDSGVNNPDPSVSEYKDMVNRLKIAPADTEVSYSRKDWKHWATAPGGGGECWNSREESLARASTPDKLVLLTASGIPTKNRNEACSIKTGEWVDPYSGKTFVDPKQLDIDHIVPLKYAETHGASKWNKERKQEFANDIDIVLLAVSAKENRVKGAKGPGEYMPTNKEYQCEYAKKFTSVINKYGLWVERMDSTELTRALDSCKK